MSNIVSHKTANDNKVDQIFIELRELFRRNKISGVVIDTEPVDDVITDVVIPDAE